MHILHILNHVRKSGNGIVNVAVDLACLQAKAGYCVGVAALEGEYRTLLTQHGVHYFTLNQTRTPGRLISAIRDYRQIVSMFQPDIVHAHMPTGLVLAKFFADTRYRLVSTVHNEFQRSATVMGWADRVIAVSRAVASSMQNRGVSAKKLCVVSNGTLGSPRTRNLADYSPLLLPHPSITTVAGMYQRKGIAELIDAFNQVASRFSGAHLYLVGDGPDRPLFAAQAQRTPCSDRIHFEGFQAEPQRYLLSTDIFVLASHKDPSPLVIPEAREAGCAIVASRVDGIPEALDDGNAGLLVPPKDSSALATVLADLLNDQSKLNVWKERAKQNLDRLRVRRVHEETLAVYQELLTQ